MRVECESCRELVVASFSIAGGAVVVTCSACSTATTIEPAAPIVAPAAAKPDARPTCPKCGRPRTDETSCSSCGLATAKMDAYAADRDAAVPDSVRAAWDQLAAQWDDLGRHDALLQLVAQHGCYAWAAARYREASRVRQGDVIAPRQLDRLRRAAEATMLASASARKDKTAKPYRSTVMVLAVLMALLAAGLVYMLVRDNTPAALAPHGLAPANR